MLSDLLRLPVELPAASLPHQVWLACDLDVGAHRDRAPVVLRQHLLRVLPGLGLRGEVVRLIADLAIILRRQ